MFRGFYDMILKPGASFSKKTVASEYFESKKGGASALTYLDPDPNDPGLMQGNTPWSGHFKLIPNFWATAHTTQFARPGWRFVVLDGNEISIQDSAPRSAKRKAGSNRPTLHC